MMNEREKVSAYWSKKTVYPSNWYAFPLTQAYINRRVTGDETVAPSAWAFKNYIPNEKVGRLLDVGCGTGQKTLRMVKSRICESGHGIDIARDAIANANQVAIQEGLADRVRYSVVDMNEPDLPPDTYDLVVCNGSLHHIMSLERAVLSIYGTLKPGGYLFAAEFTGPSRYRYSVEQTRLINEARRLLPPELGGSNPWSPEDLAAKLRADPSEAVRASEIGAILKAVFDDLVVRPFGGNVLMRALSADFFANFDAQNPIHGAALRRLIELDELSTSDGQPSDNCYYVAAKALAPNRNLQNARLLDLCLRNIEAAMKSQAQAEDVAR